MSYNPNPNYGCSTVPNYYVEDTEEFIQDYTDSEAHSEHHQVMQTGQHNVTDIYSRNDLGVAAQRQMVANQLAYHQNQGQYMQQYYYETPQPQAARHLTTVPYQDYTQAYDPRIHQYCPLTTSSLHDTTYDSAAYRSAHHNMNVAALHPGLPRTYQETMQPAPAQKQQTVKRYPIKVGTPKYYRKQPSNAIYKRPSALCLPVASQPDPAAHRKHKKPATEIQYGYTQNVPFANNPTDTQLPEKPSEHIVTEHKVGSEGDFDLKMSKLEDMFEKFEKGGDVPTTKSKTDIVKFAKFLKPKVPLSVRARQDKARNKPANPQMAEETPTANEKSTKNDEQEENAVTGDSIERLLNQLRKCELAVCSDDLDKNVKKNDDSNTEIDTGKDSQKGTTTPRTNAPTGIELLLQYLCDLISHRHYLNYKTNKKLPPCRTKSFNYQEITNQMTKSQCEVKTFETDADIERCPSVQDISRYLFKSASKSFVSKPPLDDHCALELHRSKSYIVNLIDRALSKELGTVPHHRVKEFNDMSPRKAIDMMNKHTCAKSDKELSMEITSALTDSIISNATAPETTGVSPMLSSSSSSKGKICCCNAEEPTYIKQLKQLRWGHLKHIQREVRRLEDLERFLDSCSLNPISEV